jgi:hypothetical protein
MSSLFRTCMSDVIFVSQLLLASHPHLNSSVHLIQCNNSNIGDHLLFHLLQSSLAGFRPISTENLSLAGFRPILTEIEQILAVVNLSWT